jgi:alpha-mannosidase
VQVVGFQRLAADSAAGLLTVQNLGPCRRRLRLGDRWRLVAQCDGLHQKLAAKPSCDGDWAGPEEQTDRIADVLEPWSLTFWSVRLTPQSS